MTRLRVQGCAWGQGSPRDFGGVRTKDSSGSRPDKVKGVCTSIFGSAFFLFFLKGRSWTESKMKSNLRAPKLRVHHFELRDLESKWPPNLEVTDTHSDMH